MLYKVLVQYILWLVELYKRVLAFPLEGGYLTNILKTSMSADAGMKEMGLLPDCSWRGAGEVRALGYGTHGLPSPCLDGCFESHNHVPEQERYYRCRT